MRKQHVLKRNDRNEYPSHMVFFDTETQPEEIEKGVNKSVLWFGYACYIKRKKDGTWTDGEWYRFDTRRKFFSWLMKHTAVKRKLYVYAHNMEFDFTVIEGFRYFRENRWPPKAMIIEGPPTVISYRKTKRSIAFICTLNYFRTSLARLGDDIGFSKLPMPKPDASQDEWDAYCRQDVEVCKAAILFLLDLIKTWDLGNFKLTLAGQSFAAFRHKFMNHDILIDDNEKALALAREAYCGGRTECFRLGKIKGNSYYLDINSQYPSVMRDNDFPTKLKTVIQRPKRDELNRILKKYLVIAKCRVNITEPVIPLKFMGRLVFPVGEFDVTLATPELQLVMNESGLRDVYSLAIYEKAPLFRDFVDFFYTARLEERGKGNEAIAYMLKIMMNSLYGKFGQSGRKFEDVGEIDSDEIKVWKNIDVDSGEVDTFRQFAGIIQRQSKDGESFDSHPAIAAHVTSYARVLLLKYVREAGWVNTAYTDTDSLIVNSKGYKNIKEWVDPTKLGYLKLESTTKDFTIHGCKDYIFAGVEKIKGVKKNAKRIGEATFAQPIFVGFKGMLRRGNLSEQIIKDGIKTLTREYKKGTVKPDGGIKPFDMSTIKEHGQ